ncbi:hypothetical protein QYF36_026448 [Acer negundo]|nr:hypothetical protein QYF36_026448 [Acer negundo]
MNDVPFAKGMHFLDFMFVCLRSLNCEDLSLLGIVFWRVWFLRNQLVHESKYFDDAYEYRHVVLPPDVAKLLPKNRCGVGSVLCGVSLFLFSLFLFLWLLCCCSVVLCWVRGVVFSPCFVSLLCAGWLCLSAKLVPGSVSLVADKSLKIGVVLSRGQAPGGHNVISEIFGEALVLASWIFGDGSMSIYGGFDMICSGRDKIETPEQFNQAQEIAIKLDLDGIVVIGGDDSNTTACLLAENFRAKNMKTRVIGCPKTIDGDLKCKEIPTSFGFDTACKVAAKKQTLKNVTYYITDIICKRSELGYNYGVVLIPEGLIDFIPKVQQLIAELNEILALGIVDEAGTWKKKLRSQSRELFELFPKAIQEQFLLERDPHGNVQTSMVTGYEQNGLPEEAVAFFHQMVMLENVNPDRVTLVSLVSACAQLFSVSLGGVFSAKGGCGYLGCVYFVFWLCLCAQV